MRSKVKTAWKNQSALEKVALAAVVILLIGLCGAAFFLFRSFQAINWSQQEVAASIEIGERAVRLIESHRSAHGKYPRDATDLPDLPPPTAGLRQWEYSLSPNGTQFKLVCRGNARGYPQINFDSKRGEWILDQ